MLFQEAFEYTLPIKCWLSCIIFLFLLNRLTPTYMFVLLFFHKMTGFLGEGPFWYEVQTETQCTKYWWTNLLYINNFYPTSFGASVSFFEVKIILIRESSFNMTKRERGWRYWGGLRKFVDTRKGALKKLGGGGCENLYTSKPTGEGARTKNWTASEGGC